MAWWRSWCDFANFSIYATTDDEEELFSSRGVAERPDSPVPVGSMIDMNGNLRKDAVEGLDFVAVGNQVWTYIKAWYGVDGVIMRQVVKRGGVMGLALHEDDEDSLVDNTY